MLKSILDLQKFLNDPSYQITEKDFLSLERVWQDYIYYRLCMDIEEIENVYMPEERHPIELHDKLMLLRERRDFLEKCLGIE